MSPTFHRNLTVLFSSNCCSKYSGIIVKLIYSFFTVTFTLDWIRQCKLYSEITVESGTQLKTVHICSARKSVMRQKVAKCPTVCWWICCSYAIITDQHFCNTATHWAFSFSFSPTKQNNHTCWQQYALCILSLDLDWLISQEFLSFIFIITWMQMF